MTKFVSLQEVFVSPEAMDFCKLSGFDSEELTKVYSKFEQEVHVNFSHKILELSRYKIELDTSKSYTGDIDLSLVLEDTVQVSNYKLGSSIPKNDHKHVVKKLVDDLKIKKIRANNIIGLNYNSQYKVFRLRFKLYSYKGFGGYRWSSNNTKDLVKILEDELFIYRQQAIPIDGTVLTVDPNDIQPSDDSDSKD